MVINEHYKKVQYVCFIIFFFFLKKQTNFESN
jgi:hypothetical protein